jgi:p-hydroxybenzoate 3-monooxygenase
LVHEGFELRFDGSQHRLPFTELTGWTTCMYGQQEVVKDLIRAREAAGGQLYFGVDDVAPLDVDTDAPRVRCTLQGEPVEIAGDFVAGCDAFHGVCRHSFHGCAHHYEARLPVRLAGHPGGGRALHRG